MEPDEKSKMVADLERGEQALLESLAGVTDEIATRAPVAGKWSILECVEHLAVSEDYLFSQIETSRFSDVPPINQSREALIVERGLNRTRNIRSPDVGIPNGRFPTLADALRHFSVSRDRTIRFVKGCEEDLRCKRTSHPILGTVNCYETLLMMVVHPLRHVKQIEETRAALRQLNGKPD